MFQPMKKESLVDLIGVDRNILKISEVLAKHKDAREYNEGKLKRDGEPKDVVGTTNEMSRPRKRKLGAKADAIQDCNKRLKSLEDEMNGEKRELTRLNETEIHLLDRDLKELTNQFEDFWLGRDQREERVDFLECEIFRLREQLFV